MKSRPHFLNLERQLCRAFYLAQIFHIRLAERMLRLVKALNGSTVAGIGDPGRDRVDHNGSCPGSPIPATDASNSIKVPG
jgi:hypothetical protein